MTDTMAALAKQVDEAASVRALKRSHRAQRKEQSRRNRAQWRRQVRCWFTWPLGHEFADHKVMPAVPLDADQAYVHGPGEAKPYTIRACVGCGKHYN